jgi:hypothetical protein
MAALYSIVHKVICMDPNEVVGRGEVILWPAMPNCTSSRVPEMMAKGIFAALLATVDPERMLVARYDWALEIKISGSVSMSTQCSAIVYWHHSLGPPGEWVLADWTLDTPCFWLRKMICSILPLLILQIAETKLSRCTGIVDVHCQKFRRSLQSSFLVSLRLCCCPWAICWPPGWYWFGDATARQDDVHACAAVTSLQRPC